MAHPEARNDTPPSPSRPVRLRLRNPTTPGDLPRPLVLDGLKRVSEECKLTVEEVVVVADK